jgi:hypothetical protein
MSPTALSWAALAVAGLALVVAILACCRRGGCADRGVGRMRVESGLQTLTELRGG